ncbi:MAG: 3-isopropylmalate dehydratase [Dehalobacterium sp.]
MSLALKIQGGVWLFDDNIDTDQILPGYAMAAPRERLKEYALAGSSYADFAQRVKKGDIIAAGKNFGCGSSREQAPVALKEAGVSLIIAQSFARIFRRNCINIGLPVLIADLSTHLKQEDEIVVDLKEAKITVVGSGVQILGKPLSPGTLETLACGGLINKVRKQFGLGL